MKMLQNNFTYHENKHLISIATIIHISKYIIKYDLYSSIKIFLYTIYFLVLLYLKLKL